MKAGLIGGSSQQRFTGFNDERTINLYTAVDREGVEGAALYGTPGKSLFANTGSSQGRCAFTASSGRCFAVFGSTLFEILDGGTYVSRGTVDQSSGLLTMDENGVQLAVCDGVSLYILTYATNTFTKVVTANLPSASSVTFIDGYFVVSRSPSSGIFQISAPYDGTTWGALDFATAESSPDALLRVLNVSGRLWLFGVKTTEVYYNSGANTFPFQKISGGTITMGTIAPFSPISLDNSAFWIGQDNNGYGVVVRANGFDPTVISSDAITKRLQAATDPANLYTFAYQEESHLFLMITGGGMETTLCYDLTTQQWHERVFLNDEGNYEQDLAAYITYAFKKHIAIDRRNGNVYEQKLGIYTDNGEELVRDRIFTHFIEENKRIRYTQLTVGFQVGVGNQIDPAKDPQAILYISRDGGQTWSNGIMKSLGKVGKYLTRVVWLRLGQARKMTFRVRVTDPVPVAISGAWFEAQQ